MQAAPAAADGPYVTVTASATWEDNVTNAPAGDGVLGAFMLGGGTDVSWLRAVDFSTMLSAGLSATGDVCTSYGGLDSVGAGPRVVLRHKLGLGPFAPTLSLGLEADGTAFKDHARSSLAAAASVRYGQRFSENLQLELEAREGTCDASHSVYSGTYTSLGGTLNWDLDETWRLKVTGGWRDGDIVSDYAAQRTSYGWGPIDYGAYYYTGARDLVRTFGEPFIAYRARYQTWSYGAGVSPAIGPNTSLTFQFTRYTTAAYDRYVNDLVSAGIVHHF